MKRFSYITDPFTGKITGILIDIDVWNQFLRFNPEAMHSIVGNTFENVVPQPGSIFYNEEIDPVKPIVAKDFPTDIEGMKN